jgi:hypothetical protein
MTSSFDFDSLVAICLKTHEEMRSRAVKSVNRSLVVRNWLFRWYIVQFEQNGWDRAAYGKRTLKRLSAELKKHVGRGFSVDCLEQMRRFYLNYGDSLLLGRKSETPSRICDSGKSETVSRIFDSLPTLYPPSFDVVQRQPEILQDIIGQLATCLKLNWSHYVTLLTMNDPDERRFYEIESAANHWSVRELDRQIASSLYERLALRLHLFVWCFPRSWHLGRLPCRWQGRG